MWPIPIMNFTQNKMLKKKYLQCYVSLDFKRGEKGCIISLLSVLVVQSCIHCS